MPGRGNLRNALLIAAVASIAMACGSGETSGTAPAGPSQTHGAAATSAAAATPTPAATSAPATPAASPTPAATPGTAVAAWTFDAGAPIWSSPAVSGGLVIFGSDNGRVYAVDLKTRQPRWTFASKGPVRSRPAVASGTVYASSDDGYLYAIDLATGKGLWRAEIGTADRYDMTIFYDYQASSPVVAGEFVYVGSGNGSVFAFDARTGRESWRFAAGDKIRNTPAIAEGTLFIGDASGKLHALDATTGRERWTGQGCDVSSPVVSGGFVYCGSRKETALSAWWAGDGKLLWSCSFDASWVDSTPFLEGHTLYVGSSDLKSFLAIDIANGSKRWQTATGGWTWSSPAVSKGVAYVGTFHLETSERPFYAVDTATGRILWAMPVPSGVVSSPVVADGFVYVGGVDGKLYAVAEAAVD